MVHEIDINGVKVWLYIDQLRLIDNKTREIKTEEKFLCYFKFTEPNPFVLGELIKDNQLPRLFNSSSEAIKFAQEYIKRRFSF